MPPPIYQSVGPPHILHGLSTARVVHCTVQVAISDPDYVQCTTRMQCMRALGQQPVVAALYVDTAYQVKLIK